MSSLGGGSIVSGLAGTTGAKHTAQKVQSKKERETTEAARRFQDEIELRVSGVESTDAVRPTGKDAHDQAKQQKHDQPEDQPQLPPPPVPPIVDEILSKDKQEPTDPPAQHIDVTG